MMDFKKMENEVSVTSENLHEVTSLIKTLLAKRAEFLNEEVRARDEGFPNKFFVFNNESKEVDEEVFVLKPLDSKADILALQTYSKECKNKVMSRLIDDWLRGYTDFRCSSVRRGLCPVFKSPICCAHCPESNVCVMQENTPICPLVMIGDVAHIEDCEEI